MLKCGFLYLVNGGVEFLPNGRSCIVAKENTGVPVSTIYPPPRTMPCDCILPDFYNFHER
jgi:hypothetical protein